MNILHTYNKWYNVSTTSLCIHWQSPRKRQDIERKKERKTAAGVEAAFTLRYTHTLRAFRANPAVIFSSLFFPLPDYLNPRCRVCVSVLLSVFCEMDYLWHENNKEPLCSGCVKIIEGITRYDGEWLSSSCNLIL